MGVKTTTTDVAADIQEYMSAQTLKRAKYQTVLNQFGHLENIPAGNGKGIRFTQYAELDIVTDPLTEGVAPAGSKLATSAINATIDQYGDYITITDLAGLTPKHRSMQEKYQILGTQAARSLDRAIYNVVSKGTAVRYANNKTTRDGLAKTDILKWDDVRAEVARLRQSGAREFTEVATRKESTKEIEMKAGDGNFVLVVDPMVEQDFMKDEDFKQAAIHQANRDKANELYTGTIARFSGVTVIRSNMIPTVKNTGKVDIHTSLLFGMDAYANTDLQKLKTYKQGPGGVSDPLEQIMTLGWKAAAKACILNNNWMARIESGSAY